MSKKLPWDEEGVDWEATGSEEMNQLYEDIVERERKSKALRSYCNKMAHLKSIVDICVGDLTNFDWAPSENSIKRVASVLSKYVSPHLKKIEKGLANL